MIMVTTTNGTMTAAAIQISTQTRFSKKFKVNISDRMECFEYQIYKVFENLCSVCALRLSVRISA